VGAPTVGLDSEALVAPEVVDSPRPQAGVHLGFWEPGSAREEEEILFELASGPGSAWFVAGKCGFEACCFRPT